MRGSHEEIYNSFLREIEHNSHSSASSAFWSEQTKKMQEDARFGSRFDFLRWPSLHAFSIPESWIPAAYYDELKNSADWSRRWLHLTRESKVGAPKDYSRDFGTSPILIQHAYHLMRYEQSTSKKLADCDVIFEIGGGYGSFCRILKHSGFNGLHIIYDLPNVSSIQRLCLNLSGFTEVTTEQAFADDQHRFCLVTEPELDRIYNLLTSKSINIAFVATWSLSEAPLSVREKIFPRFSQIFSSYLMAFQPSWEGIDNNIYFQELISYNTNLILNKEEMPRAIVPPSTYLFS